MKYAWLCQVRLKNWEAYVVSQSFLNPRENLLKFELAFQNGCRPYIPEKHTISECILGNK